MRVGLASALCDAVELAALFFQKDLSLKDLLGELGQGLSGPDINAYLQDALGMAQQRARACGECYPFTVSPRQIAAKPVAAFETYTFLLLGSSLKMGGVADRDELAREFRGQFEDVVCWCLRRADCCAEILSIPRGPRGLPTPLKRALVEIASRFGEPADLIEAKVTTDDNDLGVDVVATWPRIDSGRSGRPIVLVQCATGPVTDLSSKLGEKVNVFPGVWEYGFYQESSVRTVATPDDLLGLERVHWDRLSAQGWVLDRLRLVQLAGMAKQDQAVPTGVATLWQKLSKCIVTLDWRNGWRGEL